MTYQDFVAWCRIAFLLSVIVAFIALGHIWGQS